MSTLLRVLRWGTPNKFAEVENGATKGAELGVNLTYQGRVLLASDVINQPSSGNGGTGGYPVTLWDLIQNIPPNVTALANTTTTGLYTITGTGTSATRTLIEPPAGIDITNPDGVAGNPTFTLANDLAALEGLGTTGFAARTGTDAWSLRTWQNGPGVDITNPGGVAGNPSATFNSHTAPVDRIPGSTYSTVQDFINTMTSPGTIDGPALCIVESGIPATPIRVLAGKGMIRTADDDVSSLPFFNWVQTDFAQPADGLTRFYGVVYNAGTPVVQQRMTESWNKDTEIPLGSAVIFASGVAVIKPVPYKTGDADTNIIQRFDAQAPAIRDNYVGGLILGETGARNATLSGAPGGGPAKIWSRLSDFDVPAKNSATEPMLSAFFNGTGLAVDPGLTQWDNTRYNNTGTGTLVAMGLNKYANLWFFISVDGTKWGFAYGTAEYNTLGAAANEGVPAYLNQNFFQQALLLGRLIFQQGAATASLIESAFAQLFSTTAINNHNDLSGLQDAPNAVANQHYHLNSAQATDQAAMTAIGTGIPAKTGVGTYAARSFPNGTGYTWTNPDGVAGNPTLALNANLQAWSWLATASKENAITAGTTAQFWRGDKAFSNNLTDQLALGPVTANNLGFTPLLRMEGMTTPLPSAAMVRYVGSVNGPFFYGAKARGTTGAPAGTQSGDQLFQIRATGADNTGAFGSAAGTGVITFLAAETFTAAAMGTGIRFATTNIGANTNLDRWEFAAPGHLLPIADNTYDVGSGSFRCRTIYAGTGTINTSDADEKDNIRSMNADELAAASELAKSVVIHQWRDAIVDKGENSARLHSGWIAQHVRDVMAAHGLDGFRYGFLCYDEWPEQPEVWNEWPAQEAVINEATGDVIQPAIEAGRELVYAYRPAGSRYGLRHAELQAFITAGQEQRLARLEALLAV